MTELRDLTYLRACEPSDDSFLHDVFATTWASEVAALPNQNLARHVLRIQHTAEERRFASLYPGHQRFVVLDRGERAGRLYLHTEGPTLQLVDLTLSTRFRSRGIGSRVVRDLFAVATTEGRPISLRVGRNNRETADFYAAHGFRLVHIDDLDTHFEWRPVVAAKLAEHALHPQRTAQEAAGETARSDPGHPVPDYL